MRLDARIKFVMPCIRGTWPVRNRDHDREAEEAGTVNLQYGLLVGRVLRLYTVSKLANSVD